MNNVVKFNQRKRKPAAGRSAPRRIGRDFFAVLVLGLMVGGVIASAGVDTGKAIALVQSATGKLQQFAADFRSPPDDGMDPTPVSSIAGQSDSAGTRSVRAYAGRYPLCSGASATRRNCVVDGDTFYYGAVKIRVADIDAPETHPPRCAREADLGDRATRRLSELLGAGPFELVRFDRDTDRYGRKLRVVMRNGRSLGDRLVAEGLARTWTGRRQPWCPSGPST